jgi:hypothetical protein
VLHLRERRVCHYLCSFGPLVVSERLSIGMLTALMIHRAGQLRSGRIPCLLSAYLA